MRSKSYADIVYEYILPFLMPRRVFGTWRMATSRWARSSAILASLRTTVRCKEQKG